MTDERKQLIDKFQKWLDTKPRKEIIAAQCANIAEEYHQWKTLNTTENLKNYLKLISKKDSSWFKKAIHRQKYEWFYDVKFWVVIRYYSLKRKLRAGKCKLIFK